MNLYVIRHGETDWNKEKKLQGRVDIPLNENGRALARITAEKMKDIVFDVVISSPLSRAVETAQIIMGDRRIPFLLDERMMELDFCDMEGTIPEDVKAMLFKPIDEYETPLNGESYREIIDRTHSLYEELITNPENENKNILISTHGAASRAFLQSVFQDGNFWQNGIPVNCAVTIVEIKNGQVVHVDLDHIYYEQ